MRLCQYVRMDLARMPGGDSSLGSFLKWYYFPRGEMWPYTFWFRILWYMRHNRWPKILTLYPYLRMRHFEFKYGIHANANIPVGAGIHIIHGDGVHLNARSIGDRLTVYQGVTIGVENGETPSIGNDVTIYPGAVVAGGIHIGDGAVIGANSFVHRDVPAGAVVAGSPAKRIR